MTQQPIRFTDGEAYERGMGPWSQLVGEVFLDWLAPRSGLRWIDIGCGNGSFTALAAQRSAPAEIQGIDPSEAQIAFARARPGARDATFRLGDAMALPFDTGQFDVAVMALVLFFVPDPAKAVAEMTRVVAPGGTVAAYVWDIFGGGLPTLPIQAELLEFGLPPLSIHRARTLPARRSCGRFGRRRAWRQSRHGRSLCIAVSATSRRCGNQPRRLRPWGRSSLGWRRLMSRS